MPLPKFKATATTQARELVLNVLKAHQRPVTTQELWKLIVQHESEKLGTSTKPAVAGSWSSTSSEDTTRVPYPDHVVQSISYLKRSVMPSLTASNDIEKVHKRETLTEEEQQRKLSLLSKASQKSKAAQLAAAISVWKWQLKTMKPKRPVPVEKKIFGEEVGAGADWSHLNKRRQRAREEKIRTAIEWLRELQKAKKEGAQAAQTEAQP
ncbi:hypothetical protein OBBRIDRAFT_798556 [Obba rivulosa]|uniref:Uncharacterized protein n=1 Tax=Obba rivulosa TaxID=1052685 RepID=A0A8E2AID2_9APHY|nr:hypothetical protein OBBRIDRAFT_798556 [Obba rivulosa]